MIVTRHADQDRVALTAHGEQSARMRFERKVPTVHVSPAVCTWMTAMLLYDAECLVVSPNLGSGDSDVMANLRRFRAFVCREGRARRVRVVLPTGSVLRFPAGPLLESVVRRYRLHLAACSRPDPRSLAHRVPRRSCAVASTELMGSDGIHLLQTPLSSVVLDRRGAVVETRPGIIKRRRGTEGSS